jgi:hypothetical protein
MAQVEGSGTAATASPWTVVVSMTKEKEPSGRAPNGSFPQLPVRDRFRR